MRHSRGAFIVIWDRLNVHRGADVKSFIAKHVRLHSEELPPYAPDLNPVEGMWGHSKRCKLGNYCPDSVEELTMTAHEKLSQYQDDQSILRSFIRHTGLPLRI